MRKAIITVVGQDRIGIIAAVSALLARCEVNILDISQTVLQEYFTMVMLVDAGRCNISFEQLSKELSGVGETLGMSMRIQREEIFQAMHRV